MAAVSWYLLPGLRLIVDGDFTVLSQALFPTIEYSPTPTVVINMPAVSDIEEKIESDGQDIEKGPILDQRYIFGENYYKSDAVEIKVDKVSEENLTYYVADIKINDMSLISTGTYNKLGTKINRKTASKIAEKYDAIFAINTDFYTYKNRGLIIRNGKVMENNGFRDILAIFDDGRMDCFGPGDYSPQELLKMGVVETMDFGPVLVYNGKVTQDSIGGITQKTANHPRTGIGYYSEGHYLFIVADGRKEGYSLGINIEKLAQIFESYGVKLAYNLDGGGSTTMVFMDQLVNKPEGNEKQREIDSILYIYDHEYKISDESLSIK